MIKEQMVDVNSLQYKMEKMLSEQFALTKANCKEYPQKIGMFKHEFDGFCQAMRKMSMSLPIPYKAIEKITFQYQLDLCKQDDTDKVENKQVICDLLCETYQHTRMFADDLVSLKYEEKDDHEYVTAIFKQSKKTVNVTGDSGWAMIEDIMRILK